VDEGLGAGGGRESGGEGLGEDLEEEIRILRGEGGGPAGAEADGDEVEAGIVFGEAGGFFRGVDDEEIAGGGVREIGAEEAHAIHLQPVPGGGGGEGGVIVALGIRGGLWLPSGGGVASMQGGETVLDEMLDAIEGGPGGADQERLEGGGRVGGHGGKWGNGKIEK
jgi:hypothetical protein